MQKNEVVEYMAFAYKVFFEIENSIRDTVKKELNSKVGFQWQYTFKEKIDFDRAYYYQLVDFFRKYPPLQSYFTNLEWQKLMKLSSVRNQIAHMKVLTSEKFNFLLDCQKIVNEKLKIKNEKLNFEKDREGEAVK